MPLRLQAYISSRLAVYSMGRLNVSSSWMDKRLGRSLISNVKPLYPSIAMSTDELLKALDAADDGREPSPFGKLELMISGAPASVQSSKQVREAYLKGIKSQIENFKFLLTGELILNITWLLPAKSRFETDAKADIDNCIKPIIDSFTGNDGLFVDDCQLKGLYICWRHIESNDERLHFEFEFHPDEYCEKDGVAFLRLENNLCTHVNTKWPQSLRIDWVERMRANQVTKATLQELDYPYLALAGMLGGRPFHVSRVRSFPLLSSAEFIDG